MSIYPNQKRATAEAIDAYNTFNYVILTAQTSIKVVRQELLYG